jgi:ubiquitin carboxyl-terminal hydrolase 4/11
MGYCGL